MGAKKVTFIIILFFLVSVASAYVGYSYMKNPETKYYLLDPGDYFVTNIKDSKNLLKADIIIKMKEKKKYEYLCANNYLVRDGIINFLSEKSFDELVGQDNQTKLKKDIIERLNYTFDCDAIVDIYFNEFVIQ